MNFIDKLIVLIGNGERATAVASSQCWPNNGGRRFSGTLMPPTSGHINNDGVINAVYSFPINDGCITGIIRNVTGMCGGSGVGMPCCIRQQGGKCVEISTWFVIPTQESTGTPSGHEPGSHEVPGGTPILKKCVIYVLPSGYEVFVPRVKYQTVLFDGTDWSGQRGFLDGKNE